MEPKGPLDRTVLCGSPDVGAYRVYHMQPVIQAIVGHRIYIQKAHKALVHLRLSEPHSLSNNMVASNKEPMDYNTMHVCVMYVRYMCECVYTLYVCACVCAYMCVSIYCM